MIGVETIISTIFQIATKIHEQVKDVETNKKKSKELSERIQNLENVVRGLAALSSENKNLYMGSLGAFITILLDACELVAAIKKAGRVKSFISAGGLKERFLDISKRLNEVSRDLNVSLSAKLVIDQSKKSPVVDNSQLSQKIEEQQQQLKKLIELTQGIVDRSNHDSQIVAEDERELLEIIKTQGGSTHTEIEKLKDEFNRTNEQLATWRTTLANILTEIKKIADTQAEQQQQMNQGFNALQNQTQQGFANITQQQQHQAMQLTQIENALKWFREDSQKNQEYTQRIEFAMSEHIKLTREIKSDIGKVSDSVQNQTTKIETLNNNILQNHDQLKDQIGVGQERVLAQLNENAVEQKYTRTTLDEISDGQSVVVERVELVAKAQANIHQKVEIFQEESNKQMQFLLDRIQSVNRKIVVQSPVAPAKINKIPGKKEYEEGIEAETEKDLESATRAYEKAIGKNYLNAHVRLAHLYMNTANKKFDPIKAYNACQIAIDNNFGTGPLYYLFGVLNQFLKQDYAMALNCFNLAKSVAKTAPKEFITEINQRITEVDQLKAYEAITAARPTKNSQPAITPALLK